MITSIKAQEDTIRRVAVLDRIIDKKITQVEGGIELNLGERQIRRLLIRYNEGGEEALLPKPRPGRPCTGDEERQRILDLIRTVYQKWPPKHAWEKLVRYHEFSLSYESLRQWMIKDGIWTHQKKPGKPIHQSRDRRPRFGELIQMDGLFHDWFEGRAAKCCLIVSIDDATSKLMSLRFEPVESTFAYMRMIKDYIQKFGRPLACYTDRHSIFKVNVAQCTDRTQQDTQMGRALRELGIDLIWALSAQAKGRVERANKTLQARLIREMTLLGLSTIEDANIYLEEFIAEHNDQFAYTPSDPKDAHLRNIRTTEELDRVFSHIETRVVTKNLEISFENKTYQIQAPERKYRLQNQKVIVHEMINGQTIIVFEGESLPHKVFEKKILCKSADSKEINAVVDAVVDAVVGDIAHNRTTSNGILAA